MKLSELRQVLGENAIQLTKSLGQNFLHDANQLRRIAREADLHKSDKVLEIGPGLGALTELLVQEAGQVLAIEKDARLARILKERLSTVTQRAELSLIHDDALQYLKRTPSDWRDWKLVSNLPYSVASPILVELASSPSGPIRMVATLQFEVAKRLLAKPSHADYGVLTLLIQLDYEPVNWFKIPAGCFFTEPDVDSACIVLMRRPQALLSVEKRKAFAAIVKRSFSQRRKMMAKLLKADWSAASLEQSFASVGLASHTRAETVSLEQFAALTDALYGR